MCALVKLGELYYLMMIILVIVMKCESYVFELVIFFRDDDFLAYTFEMMNCIC